MRKIIQIFCSVVFVSLFILGCSNEEYHDRYSDNILELDVPEFTKGNLNIPEQYKIIGEKHNEGLEAAFAAIRKHYEQPATRSKDLTKDDLLIIAQSGLKKFCEENFDDYSNLLEKMPNKSLYSTRAQTGIEDSKVAAFLDKIKAALDNEPKSPEQLVERLNGISKEASQQLSKVEAMAVYAGISTCYNSYPIVR